MRVNKKHLYLFLGITLITQATTSIVGGVVGVGPFTDTKNATAAMNSIAGNIGGVYAGVFLQIITALVVIALGVALYQAARHINETAAVVAFGFYITEAFIHIVCQIIVFALAGVSRQYAVGADAALTAIGETLLSSRDFCGAIAMLPFGLGALLFYYMIMKAKIIPKWLGIWGLVTAPLVMIGWTLAAFGVPVPFALYVPYVPWEWVAGIYILVKSGKRNGNDL